MFKSKADLKAKQLSVIDSIANGSIVVNSIEKLIRICRKYPNIELVIIGLLKIRSQSEPSEPSVKLRRAASHELKLNLNLEIILEKSDGQIIAVEGISKDISVGGMGINLDLNQIKDNVDISSLRSA